VKTRFAGAWSIVTNMAAFVNFLVKIFACFSKVPGAVYEPLGAPRARRCKSGESFAQVWRKLAHRCGTIDLQVLEQGGERRVCASLAQVIAQVTNF
jgi:hypothetical protein